MIKKLAPLTEYTTQECSSVTLPLLFNCHSITSVMLHTGMSSCHLQEFKEQEKMSNCSL